MAMGQTGPTPRRNGDRPRRSKGSPEVPPSPAVSAFRHMFGKDIPQRPSNYRAGPSRQRSLAPFQPAFTTTTALCVVSLLSQDILSYSHSTLQVCSVKPCHDSRYVTCGLTCAETLCTTGGANANLCDVSSIFKFFYSFRPITFIPSIAIVMQKLQDRTNAVMHVRLVLDSHVLCAKAAQNTNAITCVARRVGRLLSNRRRLSWRFQRAM